MSMPDNSGAADLWTTDTSQFPLTTTGTATAALNLDGSVNPFNWNMDMTDRAPQPDTKIWEAEWAKFRQEFIRKLLANNPKGILNFKQQREKKGNKIYVKVEIEYSPDIDKGVRK